VHDHKSNILESFLRVKRKIVFFFQEIERTEMEVLLVESRNLTALAVYAGERQLLSAEDRELASAGKSTHRSPLGLFARQNTRKSYSSAGLRDQQTGLLHVKRQTWRSASVSLKAVGSQQQDLWGNNGAPHQIRVEYDVDRGSGVAGDLLVSVQIPKRIFNWYRR